MGCPILVASGSSDRHTTLEETRDLFERAKEPKRLLVFDGAGHIDLFKFDDELYPTTCCPLSRATYLQLLWTIEACGQERGHKHMFDVKLPGGQRMNYEPNSMRLEP